MITVARILITNHATKKSRERSITLSEHYGACIPGECTTNGSMNAVGQCVADLQKVREALVTVEVLSSSLGEVDWKDSQSIFEALVRKYNELFNYSLDK